MLKIGTMSFTESWALEAGGTAVRLVTSPDFGAWVPKALQSQASFQKLEFHDVRFLVAARQRGRQCCLSGLCDGPGDGGGGAWAVCGLAEDACVSECESGSVPCMTPGTTCRSYHMSRLNWPSRRTRCPSRRSLLCWVTRWGLEVATRAAVILAWGNPAWVAP